LFYCSLDNDWSYRQQCCDNSGNNCQWVGESIYEEVTQTSSCSMVQSSANCKRNQCCTITQVGTSAPTSSCAFNGTDVCVAPPPPPPTKTVKQNCSVQKYSCPFTGKTGKRKQCCSITVTCDSNNKCSEQAGQCSWVGEITWDVVAVTYKTCLSVATTENCNRIQCCEYSRVGDQVNKGNCEFQGVETCKEVVTKECHQKKN